MRRTIEPGMDDDEDVVAIEASYDASEDNESEDLESDLVPRRLEYGRHGGRGQFARMTTKRK
jgi:hypothetical protein